MKIRRWIIKLTAFFIAGILAGGPTAAFADTGETPSEKEEVVYGMLSAGGQVEGIYVVNIFESRDIVDYGDYAEVRNLTTTDEIQVDGDTIRIHRGADASGAESASETKLYYQGNLKTLDLPWNIRFRYFMDGAEYAPEEIAGMSGALTIDIEITQNGACDSSFWEGYALQATVTLDSRKCRNIQSDGATISNVGSDKQLSYIILPGKGASLEITAEVTDFEMEAVSINGVRLNLDFDADTEGLMDKIAQIQEAIGELQDGTEDMYGGASALNDGAKDLEAGIGELNDGIAQIQEALAALDGKSEDLTAGSAKVLKALETMQSSLDQIAVSADQIQALSQSSTEIKDGIDSLVDGLQDIDDAIEQYEAQLAAAGVSGEELATENQRALDSLGVTDTQRSLYTAYVSSGISGVQSALAQLAGSGDAEALQLYGQYVLAGYDSSVITEYLTEAGKLISIEALLQGDISYIQGSGALISGIESQIDSQKGQLMAGALKLQESYGEFDAAVQSMVVSLGSLAEHLGELKTAVQMLTEEYAVLDDGLGSYTDVVGSILAGYEKIYNGSASAAAGTKELYSGTADLLDGAAQLYEGASRFQEETSDMDTEVEEFIDGTMEELTGGDVATVSFVSEKNTEVDSVLFVMKTSAITVPEEEAPEEEGDGGLTILQKFLNLFRK